MTPTITTYKHLTRKPGSVLRQLFIRDRWIAARTLYGQSVGDDARTPEELANDYELPLEAVREAIAYCESDPPEIAEDQAASAAAMSASGMDDPDYRLHPQPTILSPQELARLFQP
jgi:uncharacterized protein (DUF433 family)